jgi:hypothetical protein
MTISSPVRIAGPYIGNGTATVFTFAFKVFAASNLQVVRADSSTGLESTLILNTDYTVSLNTDQDSNPGGNVTLSAFLATGFTMVITSDIANLQPTDLTNQGGFYPEVITDALDRATIQIQQMADELTRSIKIPISDGLSLDMELPTAAARANSFLAFDATGEPTVVTAGSSGAPTTITRQQFSGTGSQVAFTLASDPGALGNSCEVFIGGIYQQRDTYTIAGTTLTFTAAPVAGTDNIEVVNFLTSAIGTTDSSLVTFVPAGTGATQRTVQAKLRDTLSAKDFGAVGDGVTDDTAAIQAAINAALVLKKALFIPAGDYLLSNKLTASTTSTSMRICGEGRGITTLVWTSTATSGGGLDITYSDSLFSPEVSDMSLYTKALGVGTALKITGPESASLTQFGAIVENLKIQGNNTATNCWDIGIHFYTCWYIELQNINIKGQDDATSPFVQTCGIKLTSCQVIFADRFTIFHVENGVLEAASGVATHGEGFAFANFEIVGVTNGIVLAADGNAPGTNIGPGHINAYAFGINLANQYQTSIHDMLMYKTHVSTSNFTCMQLVDCKSNHIHDNEIHGSATATGDTLGIVVGGTTTSDFNSIHDNNFQEFYGTNRIGIVMGTGAGNANVHDNIADATVTVCVQINNDSDKTNIFKNNQPLNIQTFTANSGTPSVSNDLCGMWNTNNSAATNVTNFVDAYTGQLIIVLANDSNTTLKHSASLILKGSVDYLMVTGSLITLRKDATLWREVSRSA